MGGWGRGCTKAGNNMEQVKKSGRGTGGEVTQGKVVGEG